MGKSPFPVTTIIMRAPRHPCVCVFTTHAASSSPFIIPSMIWHFPFILGPSIDIPSVRHHPLIVCPVYLVWSAMTDRRENAKEEAFDTNADTTHDFHNRSDDDVRVSKARLLLRHGDNGYQRAALLLTIILSLCIWQQQISKRIGFPSSSRAQSQPFRPPSTD